MDVILVTNDVCRGCRENISTYEVPFMLVMNKRSGIFVQIRTDRTIPFYEGDDNRNVDVLRDILVTYSFYNFDLGYCQVST